MIKVGDWVLVEGKIGRVTKGSISEDFHTWVEVDGVMQVANDCTKLPIKFKVLKPVFKSIGRVEFWCQRRYLKDIGEVYFDISLNNGRVFVIFGALGKSPISGSVSTIDQSKDWLELQYATLLAKARGLV